MKNRKFLLFAFVLLLFATPLFASFSLDDDLPDIPDQEKTAQVVLVVGQEKSEFASGDFIQDYPSLRSYHDLNRYEPIIYNDAVHFDNKYLLTNPTNKVTVKDLSRNVAPFRFYNQSNRKFIASNLQPNSKDRA